MVEVQISEVVRVLQSVERYCLLTLVQENLTPDAAMGREDVLEKVQEMLEKLQQGASLVGPQSLPEAKINNIDNVRGKEEEEEELEEDLYDDATAVAPQETHGGTVEVEEEYEVPVDLSEANKKLSQQCSQLEHTSRPEEADNMLGTPIEETNECLEDFLRARVDSIGQVSPTEAKRGCAISGTLSKHKKKMFTKWHKRFCVVKDSLLFYFKSETENKEKGVIVLPFYSIGIDSQYKNSFKLTPRVKGRDSYQFMADSQSEFERWFTALQPICSDSLERKDSQFIYEMSKRMDHQNQANEMVSAENNGTDGVSSSMELEEETYDDLVDENRNAEEIGQSNAALVEEELYDDLEQGVPSTADDVQPEEPEFYDDIGCAEVSNQHEMEASTPAEEPIEEDLYEDIPAAIAVKQPPTPQMPLARPEPSGQSTPPPLPKRGAQEGLHKPAAIPPRRFEKVTIEADKKVEIDATREESKFSLSDLYLGTYDCTADGEDELEFQKGDYVYILDRIDANWWIGYLHHKVGLVPSSYLEEAFTS